MFNRLDANGNNRTITRKVSFANTELVSKSISEKCFSFAYNMTFGEVGEHRIHRTGGLHSRKRGEIFANAYNGKMAEFVVYEQLKDSCDIIEPDISQWKIGTWDETDLVANDKKISIKSMKYFSNLLLLEKKDWNSDGGYIPNQGTTCDFHVVVRIHNDAETIMKKYRLLYSNDDLSYEDLWEKFISEVFTCDIPGYITNNELTYLIKNDFLIYQGNTLNVRTNIDADNYYCQLGDIHRSINDLKKLL